MMTTRQTADGGHTILKQKTPDATGETFSEINITPVTLTLDQSSAICLPVTSENQRLIWVCSNQVEQHLSGAVELRKAFDRFPYPTQKEMTALAQRCSLHPDQVKVWFMIQRLRFGVSWDYTDILKVRRQLQSNQGKEKTMAKEGKADSGEKTTQKRKAKESGGGKVRGEMRKEQGSSEEGMIGENVRASEQMEKTATLEQQMKKEKDTKVAGDKKKKQKWVILPGNIGEKRQKQEDGDEGMPCQSFDQPLLTDSQSTPLKRTDADPSPPPNNDMTPENTKTEPKLDGELHAESSNLDGTVTDVDKLKALINGNGKNDSACTSPAGFRYYAKTKSQVAMMRVAFLHCQYPDSEDYEQLSTLIGVPRYLLVQWFGDTRYHIKRGRPRWMSAEQHSQALANVKYRQCLRKLVKVLPIKPRERILWRATFGEQEP
ncbi:homeobox and leucine zipper encoding b [Cheilinus undulatus]|uniref:homeobox and leucine zipper encoding b n=1 Tax=Cheilinus undulatus TaxID=241271 RepID=UPI001BD24E70|nr:homeobox and leucine zipper encoding b [Cheilinus undulatus]XP_041635420.1 homeobox and leucine zipper encoding b [Cheilinus undulatus]